ncbi:GNAT family N-acetyltransferase [Streptomyces zaomyceticus]|uniref:GNAT family N-acetyltransferase n=1 Tax=Streptomyces zaomyceticus TaxID=68286 RepID=UPI0033A9B347
MRRIVDVLSLSPLGVIPEFRRQGIGTRLVAQALEAADSRRVPLVFLEVRRSATARAASRVPRRWASVRRPCVSLTPRFRSPGCPPMSRG